MHGSESNQAGVDEKENTCRQLEAALKRTETAATAAVGKKRVHKLIFLIESKHVRAFEKSENRETRQNNENTTL